MNDKNNLLDLSSILITKEEASKLKEIVEGIEADPKAYDFLEPVDYQGLGLFDYPSIVKNPMDLSTIKDKLKSNKYSNVQEVINDINLIWNNCRLYNAKGSEIYKMANHLDKLAKKLIDKHYKPKPGSSKKSNVAAPNIVKKEEKDINVKIEDHISAESLTVQEKIQLTERVSKLSNEGITSFVRIVQKECPKALEDIDQDKLQVKVDMLDRKTYNQICTLIDSFLKDK